MPRFALLLALAALPALAHAQNAVACQNGQAGGFACEQVDLSARIGILDFDTDRNNDLWGWTDPQTGQEYALVGSQNGVSFVDVSVPDSPVILGKLPTATIASTWRDVKTYADHAFIVADGADDHGMQVFDLTRLRGLTGPPQTFTADTNYNGVAGNRPGSTHNIVINEDSGYAYLVGSDDCNGGPHMVNIQDPLNPTFEGCFASDGYTHDAQCVTYAGPDTDYTGREICVLSQGRFGPESHISLVDVTDKSNPVLLSTATYPNAVYTHQGWFTEDQRYFIANDEIDDAASANTRTIVFDVQDLDNPAFDFFHLGPLETTDHNLYIRGNYAFLSNYEGGLRILDLTAIDSGVLTEVASFDTYPGGNNESYNGQWSNYPYFDSGIVIANDRDFGLFVLKPSFSIVSTAPEVPTEEGFSLSAASPNPFADRTALSLAVAAPQRVTAELLDLTGRRVALLHEGAVGTGPLPLVVDGADLPSGLYLVRVTGDTFTATRRVSLVH